MNAEQGGILYLIFSVVGLSKLGCVVRMVVDSILPHAGQITIGKTHPI